MNTRILCVLLAGVLMALSAAHARGQAATEAADDVPEKYRETVNKGLAYLAKNQHKDAFCRRAFLE